MGVIKSMDGLSGTSIKPGAELKLKRTTFPRGTLMVEEIEVDLVNDNVRLCWCVAPFDKMVINDKKNPLVHVDYDGTGLGRIRARSDVALKFDELWEDQVLKGVPL